MADDQNGLKSAAILLLLNRDNSESTSSSESNREAEKPRRRVRRRYNQILRRFCCSYPQCNKSYGSLNHLNAHIVTKKHGQRKSRADFQFNEDVVMSPKISSASQSYPHPQIHGGQPNGYQPAMGWPSRREQASGTYWYGMPVRPAQASDTIIPMEGGIPTREPPIGHNTSHGGGQHFQLSPHAPPPHSSPHVPPHGTSGGGAPPPPLNGFPGYVLYSAPFSPSTIGPPAWQPPLPPPILASHHYLPPARNSRSSSTSSSKLPLRTFPSPPLYPAPPQTHTSNLHPITLPPVVNRIPSPPSLPPLFTNEIAKTQDNGMTVTVQHADSSSCSSE